MEPLCPLIPGLMTYSFHHSFAEGKMTPERLMDCAAELGLESLEWCHFPCHEPGKVDWPQVKLLDRLGRESAIANSIAGFAPLLARGDQRKEMLDRVRTQLEVSRYIGASQPHALSRNERDRAGHRRTAAASGCLSG